MIAAWTFPTGMAVLRRPGGVASLLPGAALCCMVAAAAYALAAVEHRVFGAAWLEPLVLAILIGTAVRTLRAPAAIMKPGIDVCAKTVLEVAVVLLGASVSVGMIAGIGAALVAGIAGTVVLAIMASLLICRMVGLPPRMALLIACGNSICGNSAIAAIAPVIDADSDDVAASIAFTAVLGVAVVLALPLSGVLLGLDGVRYGALAGLTVYAVPQVLAAAAPLGFAAVQMGTLVKLVRVLMLGPVCLALSLLGPLLLGSGSVDPRHGVGAAKRLPLRRLVPWFIIGFLLMVAARSLGIIPLSGATLAAAMATPLTVVSMAALGLGVDVRTVARAGARVTIAVVLSLLVLAALSLALIHWLNFP